MQSRSAGRIGACDGAWVTNVASGQGSSGLCIIIMVSVVLMSITVGNGIDSGRMDVSDATRKGADHSEFVCGNVTTVYERVYA